METGASIHEISRKLRLEDHLVEPLGDLKFDHDRTHFTASCPWIGNTLLN